MEYFSVSKTEASFHIEGIPDAVKIITINNPKAKRLADLSLHKEDLEFADACLDALNQTNENPIVREALWRSAIVHYMKCFGNGIRFQLTPKKIYKSESPEALLAFNYFKVLRNKHFIHDVNSYAQSIPGAVLNNGTKDYKIEEIGLERTSCYGSCPAYTIKMKADGSIVYSGGEHAKGRRASDPSRRHCRRTARVLDHPVRSR